MTITPEAGAPVVGRDRELAVLRDRLARAAAGRGGAVLVTGEAGVGKSRLVRQLATEARADGFRVLEGRSVAVGGEPLRHAALLELLRPTRHEPGGLAGAATEELLERALTAVDGTAPPAPTLLVVEDLHWADRATCEVLMVLARHVHERAAALVVTCRDDELPRGHHVRSFLAELTRAQLVVGIGLHRLGAADVARLISWWRPGPDDPTTAARIYERSGGNPLLVEELCAAEAVLPAGDDRAGVAAGDHGDGPRPEEAIDERLADVLLTRVDRLSPVARIVAGVVAAAGRPVDQGVLGDMLATHGPAGAAALREALDHHLLIRRGDDITFRHVLVAEAVYGQMLRPERAEVHARWARRLEAQDDEPAVLAHHWAEAGEPRRALAASVAAGDADLVRLVCASAVTHYRRALSLWSAVTDPGTAAGCTRVELCARAAYAANIAGDPAAAVQLVTSALAELDPGSGDVAVVRSRLLERLGWYLLRTGATAAAAERYREAVDALPADASAGDQARVLAGTVRIWERLGDHRRATEAAERAVALARASGGAAELAQARYMLGRAHLAAGRATAAVDELAAAAEAAERCRDAVTLSTALADRADGLAATGQLDVALDEARATAARLRAAGHTDPHALLVTGLAAGLLHRAGRAAEARAAAEAVAAEARSPLTLAVGHLLVGTVDLDARALGDAREHLEMARFLAAPLLDGRIGGNLALSRAELARAEGRFDDARSAIDEGIAQVERTGDDEVLGQLCLLGLRVAADRQLVSDGRIPERARARTAATVDRYEQRLAHLVGPLVAPTTGPPAGPIASPTGPPTEQPTGPSTGPTASPTKQPTGPSTGATTQSTEPSTGATAPPAEPSTEQPSHALPPLPRTPGGDPGAAGSGERPGTAALRSAWRAERARLDGVADPDLWDESARRWTAVAQPRLAVLAEVGRAEALLRRPQTRADAAVSLERALAGAELIGSRLLAEEVRQVARRAGMALPDPTVEHATAGGPASGAQEPGPGGRCPPAAPPEANMPLATLTRREREVLELVASGATNRQIASLLYISTKTASVHVSRILAKLGVASRHEAAAVARRANAARGAA